MPMPLLLQVNYIREVHWVYRLMEIIEAVKNRLGIWDGGGVLSRTRLVDRVTQQDNVNSADVHATHVASHNGCHGISAQQRNGIW
jgi:hypothetical protein